MQNKLGQIMHCYVSLRHGSGSTWATSQVDNLTYNERTYNDNYDPNDQTENQESVKEQKKRIWVTSGSVMHFANHYTLT